MADPASILGLIAASLTITIRTATIGKDLHTLISKFQNTNKKVRQLSIHVAAVRVAARSLSSWLEDDAIGSEEVEDVKGELLEVLSACCSLLSELQDHVAKAVAGTENVGFVGAVHYIWDEEIIKEATETLHHQETVLILMLQALERLSRKEQRSKLKEHAVLQTLAMAKRPSSSIFGLRGDNCSSARVSYASDSSEQISAVFTFDMEVMSSVAYRNAFVSQFRRRLPRQEEETRTIVDDGAYNMTADTIDHVNMGTDIRFEGDEFAELGNEIPAPDDNLVPLPPNSPPIPPPRTMGLHLWSTRDMQRLDGVRRYKKTVNKPSPHAKSLQGPDFRDKKSKQTKVDFCCRMLYDFEDESPGSLTLRQGDVVQVITQLESGWWDGVSHGIRGWFPSNYCAYSREPSSRASEDISGDEDEMMLSEDEDEVVSPKAKPDKDPADFWIPQVTPDGRLFHFNTLTGVSTMEEL